MRRGQSTEEVYMPWAGGEVAPALAKTVMDEEDKENAGANGALAVVGTIAKEPMKPTEVSVTVVRTGDGMETTYNVLSKPSCLVKDLKSLVLLDSGGALHLDAMALSLCEDAQPLADADMLTLHEGQVLILHSSMVKVCVVLDLHQSTPPFSLDLAQPGRVLASDLKRAALRAAPSSYTKHFAETNGDSVQLLTLEEVRLDGGADAKLQLKAGACLLVRPVKVPVVLLPSWDETRAAVSVEVATTSTGQGLMASIEIHLPELVAEAKALSPSSRLLLVVDDVTLALGDLLPAEVLQGAPLMIRPDPCPTARTLAPAVEEQSVAKRGPRVAMTRLLSRFRKSAGKAAPLSSLRISATEGVKRSAGAQGYVTLRAPAPLVGAQPQCPWPGVVVFDSPDADFFQLHIVLDEPAGGKVVAGSCCGYDVLVGMIRADSANVAQVLQEGGRGRTMLAAGAGYFVSPTDLPPRSYCGGSGTWRRLALAGGNAMPGTGVTLTFMSSAGENKEGRLFASVGDADACAVPFFCAQSKDAEGGLGMQEEEGTLSLPHGPYVPCLLLGPGACVSVESV